VEDHCNSGMTFLRKKSLYAFKQAKEVLIYHTGPLQSLGLMTEHRLNGRSVDLYYFDVVMLLLLAQYNRSCLAAR